MLDITFYDNKGGEPEVVELTPGLYETLANTNFARIGQSNVRKIKTSEGVVNEPVIGIKGHSKNSNRRRLVTALDQIKPTNKVDQDTKYELYLCLVNPRYVHIQRCQYVTKIEREETAPRKVQVGQFWVGKDSDGISLVLGVRDGIVLADYRQDSCDSRVYYTTTTSGEFMGCHSLVTDRQKLDGLLPSEWNDIADFYLEDHNQNLEQEKGKQQCT